MPETELTPSPLKTEKRWPPVNQRPILGRIKGPVSSLLQNCETCETCLREFVLAAKDEEETHG